MASSAKTTPAPPPRSALPKVPKLLVEWQSGPAAFVENLRAVLFQQKSIVLTSRPATFWSDVFVHRPLAKREIVLSYLLHALVASLVYLYPWIGMLSPRTQLESPAKDTTISYYKL